MQVVVPYRSVMILSAKPRQTGGRKRAFTQLSELLARRYGGDSLALRSQRANTPADVAQLLRIRSRGELKRALAELLSDVASEVPAVGGNEGHPVAPSQLDGGPSDRLRLCGAVLC